MNSIWDLCEYKLNVRECQKLNLCNIGVKEIVLGKLDKDIYNNKMVAIFNKAKKIYIRYPDVFMKNSIYELIDYGISESIADKIRLKGLDINDFIEKSFQQLYQEHGIKNVTYNKIKKAISQTNYAETEKEDKNIIHLKNNIEKIKNLCQYGLTTTSCNRILNNNIIFEELIYMSLKDMIEILKISEPTAYNIILVCNEYKKDNGLSLLTPIKSIEKFIYENTLRTYISYKEILLYCKDENVKCELDDILVELINQDKIIEIDDKYRYRYIHIEEIINSYNDEKMRKIIRGKLQGKTLQEIGNTFGLTRERIRQIINKELKKEKIYEEIYYNFFTEYFFSEEEFCLIFNEKKESYNYLDYLYSKGEKGVFKFIEDFPDMVDEDVKNKINDIYNLIDIDGEKIKLDAIYIINNYLKKIKNPVSTELIYTELNNELKKYGLSEISERSLEARLIDRDTITYNAISTINRKFRFYDYSNLKNEDIIKINNIINSYDDGFYSTGKPFKDYKDFFEKIDIRDEYELHSLIRTLKIGNISLDRMPIFIVGNIQKYDFFLEKITEKAPIDIEEFLQFLYEEYGHKTNTMKSYICSEFKDCIAFNKLDTNLNKFKDEQILLIKEYLLEEVYSIKDFRELINQILGGNYNKYLNNYNLKQLGYKASKNYIINYNISSLENFWTKHILENEIYQLEDEKYNTTTYKMLIKSLEKQSKILKIAENKYITKIKLEELGITEEVILAYIKKIRENFEKDEFFSIYTVHNKFDFEDLDKFGFEDIFYESILYGKEEFQSLKMNGVMVFKHNDNIKITQNEFIKELIKRFSPIDIYNFVNYLKMNFNIICSKEDVQQICIEANLYYDKIMEKIFYSKEHYYKEVYDNV